MTEPITEPIIVYGHPTCPGVGPIKAMLSQVGVAFDYVNIRQDPQAAARVRAINAGNESVPTLVFPDGSTLTEPSAGQLKRKLEGMGYHVPFWAWLIGNSWLLLMGGVMLFALLRFFEIL